MFEYLMPLVVMPTYENTLLDQTYNAVVRRQIQYGRQRGVPWGISESGYNKTDVQMNYQYKAFGVPGLGLKRGLAEDLVVAPYASVMVLMVAPEAACKNLELLAASGCTMSGVRLWLMCLPTRERSGFGWRRSGLICSRLCTRIARLKAEAPVPHWIIPR